MRMLSFVAVGLFTLISIQSSYAAEGDAQHAQGTQQPGATGSAAQGDRSTVDTKISERELKFLSDHFFMSQVTLWNKYSDTLPKAIDKAMKGDESEVAPILTDLMFNINPKQAERLGEDAAKESKDEKAKKPEGGEDRFIALMDRLVWGAKFRLETPAKEEEAQKYNKEFEKAKPAIEARNQEILEKVKQAADGNAQAKEWLRKMVDPRSLLSFAEGQKKFGNGALGDRLIDAMSFTEGKNKFLDMSLQDKTQRLHLGTNGESVGKAVDGLIANRGGFLGATVGLNPLTTTPMEQWFMDPSGKFTAGSPANFSYTPNPTPTQPPAKNPPQDPPGQTQPPKQIVPPNQGTKPGPKVRDAKLAADLMSTGKCGKCHSAELTPNGDIIINGESHNLQAALDAFEKIPAMKKREDKAQLKAELTRWFNGQ